jgi:hypothetical protein
MQVVSRKEAPRRGSNRDRGFNHATGKNHMKTLHHNRAKRYSTSQLNLFDWAADQELRAADPVTRRIAQRYGLTIHHAKLIVQHAEIGDRSR